MFNPSHFVLGISNRSSFKKLYEYFLMYNMRKCNGCKEEFDDSVFIKHDSANHAAPLIEKYYKLCLDCRAKGRLANDRRKDKKLAQAKEHYQTHKEYISKRNKEYREKNREKLKAYDKSPQRKEMHRKWKKLKRLEDPSTFLFYAATRRAKINNIIFTISKDDIRKVFPDDKKCPILGIDLFVSNKITTDNSPSLDRIIPDKGYVPDNIIVISHRANRIKNNATVEELEKVVLFLKELNNA